MDSLEKALGAVEGEVQRIRRARTEPSTACQDSPCSRTSRITEQDAVRGLRAKIRARATKEKRATCPHPEEVRRVYPSGQNLCRACGKQWRP